MREKRAWISVALTVAFLLAAGWGFSQGEYVEDGPNITEIKPTPWWAWVALGGFFLSGIPALYYLAVIEKKEKRKKEAAT